MRCKFKTQTVCREFEPNRRCIRHIGQKESSRVYVVRAVNFIFMAPHTNTLHFHFGEPVDMFTC